MTLPFRSHMNEKDISVYLFKTPQTGNRYNMSIFRQLQQNNSKFVLYWSRAVPSQQIWITNI